MLPASAVPTPLPARPDLAVVSTLPDPDDPYPWADATLRHLLARLAPVQRRDIVALGKPRNIISCRLTDKCHIPLLLVYNDGCYSLHPARIAKRGGGLALCCPACGTERAFTERSL